jgi:hypothetical protein
MYCGQAGDGLPGFLPAGLVLVAGDTVAWHADGDTVHQGFILCAASQPPPVAPHSPPSPPALPPPPHPPGECALSCHYSGDGDCDDGGPGAETNICAPGQDCEDCGMRYFDSCGIGCHTQWLSNNVCDDACNLYSCSHDNGQCTLQQVTSKCLNDLQTNGRGLLASTPPSGELFKAEVGVVRIRVVSDQVTGATHVVANLRIRSHWNDSRLYDPSSNPCRRSDVMRRVLSLTAQQARDPAHAAADAAQLENWWLPSLNVREQVEPPAPAFTTTLCLHHESRAHLHWPHLPWPALTVPRLV